MNTNDCFKQTKNSVVISSEMEVFKNSYIALVRQITKNPTVGRSKDRTAVEDLTNDTKEQESTDLRR